MHHLPTRILPTSGLAAAIALTAASAAVAGSSLPHRSTSARFATPATYVKAPRRIHAVTYDRAAVPVGSWARVTQSRNKWGGMDVRLQVGHLRAGTRYRAEVHVGTCGVSPGSSGRAFQNGPSTGDYAANEFWLNFRTDHAGDASVLTQHYWGIARHQHAGSVVIHTPGNATAVAGCITVPFVGHWFQ
jgi:hypothetical protein